MQKDVAFLPCISIVWKEGLVATQSLAVVRHDSRPKLLTANCYLVCLKFKQTSPKNTTTSINPLRQKAVYLIDFYSTAIFDFFATLMKTFHSLSSSKALMHLLSLAIFAVSARRSHSSA